MDWIAGQVLDALDEHGVANDTLVVFTSDNGPWRLMGLMGGSVGILTGAYSYTQYNLSDTGKGSTWQGGIQMPAVARWPGVTTPGSVTHGLVSTMDVMPTMSKLAGVPLPTDRVYDGQDLTPLLAGTSGATGHSALFHYRMGALFAVSMGPWKAHFATNGGFSLAPTVVHDPPLLFNIDADPSEEYAIDASSQPAVMQAIMAAVKAHNATLPWPPVPELLSASDKAYGLCCNNATQCVCHDGRGASSVAAGGVGVTAGV